MKTSTTIALIAGGVLVYLIYKGEQAAATVSQNAATAASNLNPFTSIGNIFSSLGSGISSFFGSSSDSAGGNTPLSGTGNTLLDNIVDPLYYDTGIGAITDWFNGNSSTSTPSAQSYSMTYNGWGYSF